MKIIFTNSAGNVAKTTLSNALFALLPDGYKQTMVETINRQEDDTGLLLSAVQSSELQVGALISDDLLIEIGASNAEEFFKQMTKSRGAMKDFDLFIIPCVPGLKQQKDTLSTLQRLIELGVEPSQIYIMLNQYPFTVNAHIDEILSAHFRAIDDARNANLKQIQIIPGGVAENDFFKLVKSSGFNFSDLNKLNLTELQKNLTEAKKQKQVEDIQAAADAIILKRLWDGFVSELKPLLDVIEEHEQAKLSVL